MQIKDLLEPLSVWQQPHAILLLKSYYVISYLIWNGTVAKNTLIGFVILVRSIWGEKFKKNTVNGDIYDAFYKNNRPRHYEFMLAVLYIYF